MLEIMPELRYYKGAVIISGVIPVHNHLFSPSCPTGRGFLWYNIYISVAMCNRSFRGRLHPVGGGLCFVTKFFQNSKKALQYNLIVIEWMYRLNEGGLCE